VGGQLLTAEANGTLWRTDPATGRYERLGRPEFAATTFAFPAGDKLYTIEKNGSLYRVSVR
jgi:hypothetical protein